MTHIIHPTADGVAITTPTGEVPIEQVAEQVAPDGIYAIVTVDAIPADTTFRGAWAYANGSIEIDLDKAKKITHNLRRAMRAEEFAPLDQTIAFRLPGATIKETEKSREEVRDKYAEMQEEIDLATDVEQLKVLLEAYKEKTE